MIFFIFGLKRATQNGKVRRRRHTQYVVGIVYMAVTTAATKTATWSTNERTNAREQRRTATQGCKTATGSADGR